MQELLVGLIVACAAWAVIKRYAPKALTRAVRRQLARMFKAMGLSRAAGYFGRDPQASDCSSGCGSCGGCGSAEPSAKEQPLRRMR